MQIWKIITLSNDFIEFSNSFYLIPKIETDSKKWSQMTILMLFYSYRRCTSSKIGKRKMSKIQIFEETKKKTWKCGVVLEDLFPQRFFKHFQYVYPYWPKCQASGRTLEGSPLARFIIMYFLIQKMSQCPDFPIRTFYFVG